MDRKEFEKWFMEMLGTMVIEGMAYDIKESGKDKVWERIEEIKTPKERAIGRQYFNLALEKSKELK